MEQSIAVAKAAVATRAMIGRVAASCYVHIGTLNDSPQERSSYLVDVVQALEGEGLKVQAGLSPVYLGVNLFSRMIIEW